MFQSELLYLWTDKGFYLEIWEACIEEAMHNLRIYNVWKFCGSLTIEVANNFNLQLTYIAKGTEMPYTYLQRKKKKKPIVIYTVH